ncbi:phosphatidylserine decarboxylase [Candidatus Scalindua japonica]|uniref:Phosphatidylserine decarboxylase proenzyme n=1 Tax=Candidatus Scalindua japonica TaxID=1284222 RepID=A0A286TWS6_9BACT|nr:phosphatidylserine decarboxylase family protein [Candidatus Scalindua japonica]GAX60301.1 phosphatidylserine decarboxylase [Candidatus Scalindua japonica]
MRFPFAEYGSRELSFFGMFLFVMIVLSLFFYPLACIPFFIFLLFVFYFFRDPERNIPEGENSLVSPADGRIIAISHVQEENYLKCKALKIAIFMSLFSVHVNRISYGGKVEFIKHVPGKFLDARSPDSSEMNEHNLMGIMTDNGKTKIMIKQVAGKVARRIVCDCSIGQDVERGKRFGMIKFGSRLEVYIPEEADFQVAVKEGQMVSAGSTILGTLKI